jgi:nitroreductase/NAD-dependent dihydropyrimidine dehydrogenase PreA subunit
MDQILVSIDQKKCILCGSCVDVCTRSIIELGENSARVKAPERCILCGHCKSICPEDAFTLHPLEADEFEPVLPENQRPTPDTLLAFFRSRRSIRFFKRDSVSKEIINKIIQAGRYIPTGGNRQPLHFLVLHSPEIIAVIREKIHDFLRGEALAIQEALERHRKFGDPLPPRADVKLGYAPLWRSLGRLYQQGKDLLFFFAPVIVVLHLHPEKASPFGVDAGLAAMQMVLMAEALGLGTCFSGFLSTALNASPDLKNLVKIPMEHNVMISFMIGHPDIRFLRTVARNPARVTYL